MPTTDCTTPSRTFHHLSPTDRGQIQALHEQGFTQNEIAQHLHCSQSTVSRELKRGTVTQMKSDYTYIKVYKADVGQRVAEENHKKSGLKRNLDRYSSSFLNSLRDAICPQEGYRVHSVDTYVHTYKRLHPDEHVPCTKTVYTLIDLGMLDIKNIDLPRKVTMRPRKSKPSDPKGRNKKKLGTSIDDRDPEILTRKEFGHWELDLVLGKINKGEPVVITLLERKTRKFLTHKVWTKSADKIADKVWQMLAPYYKQGAVKTITTDNGTEFSTLSSLESQSDLRVFFAHAYSSWEKGSNERHNGLLREFLPKGESLKPLTYKALHAMTEALNNRPRRILDYHSPNDLFEQELTRLHALSA